MKTRLRQYFFTSGIFDRSVTTKGHAATIVMPLFISFLMVISTSVFAAKKFSAANGNWTTGSTWIGGVVPVANDTVFILKQHEVDVTGNLYSNSTYMFVIVIGTLDMSGNGKLSFSGGSKVVVETGGRIVGDGSQDQISIGTAGAEYSGSQGTITGPAYVSDGHSPTSGEGTSGCNCYNGIGVASCTITSSDGYTANVLVWARKLLVETNPCPSGYNYDVRMDYSVQFTNGSPSGGLWTLQGNIHCGSTSLFFDLPNLGGTGTVDSNVNAWTTNTDCATATIQSRNCLNATIEIYGPGIANQTCSTPLPIELISFEGTQCNNAICLTWATASEQNVDKFIIEHSADGLHYDSIGFIPATGNSKLLKEYDFQHLFAALGKNYYRLKSVDFDLASEYSPVILTHFEGDKNIVVFPNPVIESSVQVLTNFTPAIGDKVEIFDNLGLKLMEYEISTPDSKLTFNWTLKHGSYLLRYVSGNYSKTIRFTSN